MYVEFILELEPRMIKLPYEEESIQLTQGKSRIKFVVDYVYNLSL